MIVHNKPLEWYVEKLKKKDYFSQGMFGDGEWIAMFGKQLGRHNAEGTEYTADIQNILNETMLNAPPNFLLSVPAGLADQHASGIGQGRIDTHMPGKEFYEKDMWDVHAREGTLGPFIKQLQGMKTCIISNKALRGLTFLNYDHFIEIGYPNCRSQIPRVLVQSQGPGDDCVYLISAGLPAAYIARLLHRRYPRSFALDLGSIWDAYVGIGAQRGWRGELYADPEAYADWLSKAIPGRDGQALDSED